jgi:predicted transcriptional regulator
MTETENVLLVTIGGDDHLYDRGLDAIEKLDAREPIDQPPTIRFANEHQLGEVFNERTYRLLRVIREDEPDSIREAARLVNRDVKNVHEELSGLEALGVIRFVVEGQAKRPVFPYDDLVISPLGGDDRDTATATS